MPLPHDTPSAHDFAALAVSGRDAAIGRAVASGVDGDGNPIYDISAISMFKVDNKVKRTDVVPSRFYAGVLVTPPAGETLCFGFRAPFDDSAEESWVWLVTGERIDWDDCEPAGGTP